MNGSWERLHLFISCDCVTFVTHIIDETKLLLHEWAEVKDKCVFIWGGGGETSWLMNDWHAENWSFWLWNERSGGKKKKKRSSRRFRGLEQLLGESQSTSAACLPANTPLAAQQHIQCQLILDLVYGQQFPLHLATWTCACLKYSFAFLFVF